MKKKLRAGAQIAAFAAVGAAGFASAGAAQAQALFELRTWSGPRYYDEAPRVYREAPPRYMDRGLERGFERGALPRRAVRSIIERQGYEVIGPIQLNGEVYIVPVEDMRGRVRRLVVDARDGEIIDRAGPGGPPRPPANMGRARERYASAPDASLLPPLPLEPSSRWRGYESRPVPPPPAIPRERIARGAPDAGYGLGERYGDRDDYQVEPGIGPVPPPPPAPGAGERRLNERKPAERAARPKPPAQAHKPARQQQAARPPAEKPASKQEANAPAAPTPAPVEATVPRPESKPDAQASVRPEAKPEAPAAAAKREPMLPKAGAGDTRSEQARREAEKRNASILRRPGSRDEGKAQRAEGPTISSGAEPQRASPRVVYPGPGAPAPQQATPPAE